MLQRRKRRENCREWTWIKFYEKKCTFKNNLEESAAMWTDRLIVHSCISNISAIWDENDDLLFELNFKMKVWSVSLHTAFLLCLSQQSFIHMSHYCSFIYSLSLYIWSWHVRISNSIPWIQFKMDSVIFPPGAHWIVQPHWSGTLLQANHTGPESG